MGPEELWSRFAVALGIGLLVGLERGWSSREAVPGSRTAGIRTFAITGLLGGTTGAIAQALRASGDIGAAVVVAVGFAAYAGAITAFSRDENRADRTFSATTPIAGMLTFALSVYALLGNIHIAAAAAVAAVILLALRQVIHRWVEQITWPELRSGLILLTMSFVALPLIPDGSIGPYGGVNLREVWLIAIALAAVSFLGYAGVKYAGPRSGILLGAVAGGLVSSTAVTVANARHAATGEGVPKLLAAGVAVATAISFVRVMVITLVLRPGLLTLLAPPLIAATVVAIGYAFVTVRLRLREPRHNHEIDFRNPFELHTVIGFAVFLSLIILAGEAVTQELGAGSVIAGAAVLGFADVDAVTVAMTRLAGGSLDWLAAVTAILLAVATNTLTKIAIATAVERGRFAVEVAMMTAGCALAAGVALWLAIAAGVPLGSAVP